MILNEYTDYGAYANTLYRMYRKAYLGIYETLLRKKKSMQPKVKKIEVFKLDKHVCARVIAYCLFL